MLQYWMKAISNMRELLVQATPDQGGRPAEKSCICFGTVNVERISGRANEIVEMLTQWKSWPLLLARDKMERRIGLSDRGE